MVESTDQEDLDVELGEVPSMLANRRASEGLSAAEAIRCLDMPRKRIKVKRIE